MSAFNAVSQINRWNDSLVFFKDDFIVIGFLIPQQAMEINDYIGSQRDLQMTWTLYRNLYGNHCGSAGKENEDFLCRFIQKSKMLKDGHAGSLTLSGEKAYF